MSTPPIPSSFIEKLNEVKNSVDPPSGQESQFFPKGSGVEYDTGHQQIQYFSHRTKMINDATFSKIRKYQVTDFEINKNYFYMTSIKYAVYMTCFILIIMSLMVLEILPPVLSYVLVFIVFVSYMFVYYVETKKNMIRRPYDFSKLYWDIQFKKNEEF